MLCRLCYIMGSVLLPIFILFSLAPLMVVYLNPFYNNPSVKYMMINTKSEAVVVKQIQDNEVIFNRDLKWLERITSMENIGVDSLDLSLKFDSMKAKIDGRIKNLRTTRELLKYTPHIKIDYLKN